MSTLRIKEYAPRCNLHINIITDKQSHGRMYLTHNIGDEINISLPYMATKVQLEIITSVT